VSLGQDSTDDHPHHDRRGSEVQGRNPEKAPSSGRVQLYQELCLGFQEAGHRHPAQDRALRGQATTFGGGTL